MLSNSLSTKFPSRILAVLMVKRLCILLLKMAKLQLLRPLSTGNTLFQTSILCPKNLEKTLTKVFEFKIQENEEFRILKFSPKKDFVSPILGKKNNFLILFRMKYQRISSYFGAKIQICLKVRFCQNWILGQNWIFSMFYWVQFWIKM